MEIIVGRKGNQPFSITDNLVSGKHLKLTTLPDGNVEVEDLGSSNGTFINGVRIIKKVVSRDTLIFMGSRYSFKVSDALPALQKIADKGESVAATPKTKTPPEYSIAHLQGIWEEYEYSMARIREKSQKMAKKRMIPIMLGSVSGIISAFVGQVALVTIPIAVLSFGFLAFTFFEKDTSLEDSKAAKDVLIKRYVCPNPECHRSLPHQDYLMLSQNPNCPYCKCKWTVK